MSETKLQPRVRTNLSHLNKLKVKEGPSGLKGNRTALECGKARATGLILSLVQEAWAGASLQTPNSQRPGCLQTREKGVSKVQTVLLSL